MRGKEKEDGNSTSEHFDGNENNFGYENSKSSSEEPDNSKSEDNHTKKMNEIEKCLEAITNRSDLQKIRVVRLYSV